MIPRPTSTNIFRPTSSQTDIWGDTESDYMGPTTAHTNGTGREYQRTGSSTPESVNSYENYSSGNNQHELQWNPDTNSLLEAIDLLPQPYRLLNEILNESILDHFWMVLEKKQEAEGSIVIKKRGIQIEGQEEPEEINQDRVQYSSQQFVRPTEMTAALPSRIITPVFPAATSQEVVLPTTILASCASTSLDGRYGLLGSKHGLIYVLDLNRGYNFMYYLGLDQLNHRGENMTTATTISASPILRGDEDLINGDETEYAFNYTIAWTSNSSTGPTVKVATMNSHSWTFYEGCTIQLPRQSTPVTQLKFSHDSSHIAITFADSSVNIYQLRAHRYDPKLEPPKLTQKEILSNTKLAAAAVAAATHTMTGPKAHIDTSKMNSTADLNDILNENDFDGLGGMELKTLTFLQQKLYTATLVLQVPPPRTVVPNSAQEEKQQANTQSDAKSTSTTSRSVTSPKTKSTSSNNVAAPSNPTSPLAGATKTSVNRRASLKMEKEAAAAAPPPDLTALQSPQPLVPVSVFFLYTPRERAVGELPTYVTRGVCLAWKGDTKWAKWDLVETQPVLPAPTPITSTTTINEKTANPSSTINKKTVSTVKDPSTVIADTTPDVRQPPSNTFILGSPLTAVAMDLSTNFLACGLLNGSTVLFDLRLGAQRGVLNALPILSHGPAAINHAVTSINFYQTSHLVIGTANKTVITFNLPKDLLKTINYQAIESCPARISGKLPGPVKSVKIGTKIALAIVGVESSNLLPEEFFIYDFVSNFVLGKLVSGLNREMDSANNTGLIRTHGSFSPNATGEFPVYEEKDQDSDGLAKALVLPLRQLSTTSPFDTARDQFSFRAPPTHANHGQTIFHALANEGPFVSNNTEQILLVGSTPGQTTTNLLVYSLTDLILALYPSITTTCNNAFLRQQHAIAFFNHYPLHMNRRAVTAFNAFLDELNQQIAASNQNQLHQAFAKDRGSSIMAGSSKAGGSKSGHQSRSSFSKKPGTHGRFKSNLSHISSDGSEGSGGSTSVSKQSTGIFPIIQPSIGTPQRSLFATSTRPSVSSHSRHSSHTPSHGRTPSKSPSRKSKTKNPLGALIADPIHPPDAAFLVHQQLASTIYSSGDRAQMAKARRVELQLQLKQQQRIQQQTRQFQPAEFPPIK